MRNTCREDDVGDYDDVGEKFGCLCVECRVAVSERLPGHCEDPGQRCYQGAWPSSGGRRELFIFDYLLVYFFSWLKNVTKMYQSFVQMADCEIEKYK